MNTRRITLQICCLVATTFTIACNNCYADAVTSTATARIGSDESEVVATQTDMFLPLMTESTGSDGGALLVSRVDAEFTSADTFEVDMFSSWDFRGVSDGGTRGFGSTFEYEFEADGTSISITGSGISLQPLFSGASTFGGQDFRWRLFNLTAPSGFNARDFAGDGTQTFSTIVGHEYILQLRENSSVSAGVGSSNLGLFHSGNFNVSVPAKFSSVPEPGTAGVVMFTLAAMGLMRRKR